MIHNRKLNNACLLFIGVTLFLGALADDCCQIGDTKADEDDCTKYYACCTSSGTGQFVPKSCPSGEYWNAAISKCEKDNGQCIPSTCTEGETEADSSDCTKYKICKDGQLVSESCDSGDYWNAAISKCEKDNGQCIPCTCTEGETQADPSDCTKYQICKNGVLVSESCDSGDYWNADSGSCEKDNGECNPGTCEEGETQADPSDCTKYQICKNGVLVSESCDSGDYWNADSGSCEKDNGECNPGTCEEGQTQADPSDCTKYQICKNGVLVSESCDSGDYWNADSNRCETDNGQCKPITCTDGDVKANPTDCTKYQICKNGSYVSASCDSGDYWNANSNKCETDNGQCIPATCTDGELQENPADCAGYIECLDNTLVKRKCPSKTYFDTTLKACVIDSEGVCIPKVCDPECCDLPNDWMGPVDNNCSAFIHCLYGHVIQQNCPNNLQFNNITKQCDYPDVVKCDDGSPPPSGPTAGPSGTYCESQGRCVGQRDGTLFAAATSVNPGAYIVCQCECEVNMSCVSGLVFNEQLKSCDWPASSYFNC